MKDITSFFKMVFLIHNTPPREFWITRNILCVLSYFLLFLFVQTRCTQSSRSLASTSYKVVLHSFLMKPSALTEEKANV